ncbi:hypothetical protein CTZ27_30130 [Streptomyces griseocarneus]|nr:hypothetical protein CTZ27_30130 [Streptomyces griseocarneus]
MAILNPPVLPADAYAQAPGLEAEALDLRALEAELDTDRDQTGRATRELLIRKAALLDRTALRLDATPAAKEHADRLAVQAAQELRAHDNTFGTWYGQIPPYAIEYAGGRDRDFVRSEYEPFRAGKAVPYWVCQHDDCPTRECAVGEGYWDAPGRRDPQFPMPGA